MTEGFNQKGMLAKSGEVKPTIKLVSFDEALNQKSLSREEKMSIHNKYLREVMSRRKF